MEPADNSGAAEDPAGPLVRRSDVAPVSPVVAFLASDEAWGLIRRHHLSV